MFCLNYRIIHVARSVEAVLLEAVQTPKES